MSKSYYESYASVYDIQDLNIVTEAEVVLFNDRENELLRVCAERANYWPDYTYLMRQRETFNVSLSNALLLGNTGALVYEDEIILESMLNAKKCLRSPSYRKNKSLDVKFKKGKYSSIFYLPEAKNLYHWLIECLPRLFVLTEYEQNRLTIILHEDINELQMNILNTALNGVDKFSIEFIGREEKWRCEEYVFPSFAASLNCGYLPEKIATRTRDRIMRGYGVEDRDINKRIYISRDHAESRRVVNKKEIFQVLDEYDFDVVHLENMSYSEQVSLLRSSNFVIGPHGAGLSNILYCDDAKVLELYSPARIRPHYFMLSKSLGHNYDYLIGQKVGYNQDFSINPSRLERKIVGLMS